MAWFAPREDDWEAASERTLAAQSVLAERLDIESAASLYPSFRGDELVFVLYEPQGGMLRAERSTKTLAAQAVSHGARIVRAHLRDRFPALAEAPLARARSCRYEITAGTRLIGARHSDHPSVWIVGGGSGHGLKHGPPLAEHRDGDRLGHDTPCGIRPRREIRLRELAHGEFESHLVARPAAW